MEIFNCDFCHKDRPNIFIASEDPQECQCSYDRCYECGDVINHDDPNSKCQCDY